MYVLTQQLLLDLLRISKDFIPKLKTHLLGRLLGQDFEGDDHPPFTDAEINSVRIIGDHIYSVKVLRINYTTYDIRRDQDSLNPRTHCDVMLHSAETDPGAHPFWYARVLGVFHTKSCTLEKKCITVQSSTWNSFGSVGLGLSNDIGLASKLLGCPKSGL